MADSETWSQRFEREFEAAISLLRRRPMLALGFAAAMIFFGWHQFFKSEEPVKTNDSATKVEPAVQLPSDNAGSQLVPKGSTGWIYVGTRIKGEWRKSKDDGIEPRLTLSTIYIPKIGATYRVSNPLNLRVGAPVRTTDGSRPAMPDSKGGISAGALVKIHDVEIINITHGEKRAWIWAQVTLIEMPFE